MSPAELSDRLRSAPGCSFLRLGDGELRFLLEMQSGRWRDDRYDCYDRQPHADEARGTLGLTSKDFPRLIQAYENCTVLDTYAEQPYNKEHLAQLDLNRIPGSTSIGSTARRSLLAQWICSDWKYFLTNRRVLFCGAEAAILRELLNDVTFPSIIAPLWPSDATCSFLPPLEEGRHLSRNLDRQKSALIDAVQQNSVEVILLSLGGTAKILAHEVARECGACAIDFGSMMRGLTYSGSDGQATWRASHNPFFHHVPLATYFPALLRAVPGKNDLWYLAKSHAQLLLDLQYKVIGETRPADAHDGCSLSTREDELRAFETSYEYYQAEIRPRFASSTQGRRLAADLTDWLVRNRIPARISIRDRSGATARRARKKLRDFAGKGYQWFG